MGLPLNDRFVISPRRRTECVGASRTHRHGAEVDTPTIASAELPIGAWTCTTSSIRAFCALSATVQVSSSDLCGATPAGTVVLDEWTPRSDEH